MKTKILILSLCIGAVITGVSCSNQNQRANNQAANGNTALAADHSNHQNMDHGTMSHSEMQSSPDAAKAPFDLQFLDTMIAHHQGAVEMAKPAAAKAQHTEVKTLATSIFTDQEKEIAQMRRWREEWFSGNPSAVNMEMAGMMDSMKGMDMKNLESSAGNDFDLEFIGQMIPHHEGAIVMAKEALQKSQKEEIKKLANEIIKAQEAEIKQMKDWQTVWSK
jgi:uncharacterized protein (DUF305 family)